MRITLKRVAVLAALSLVQGAFGQVPRGEPDKPVQRFTVSRTSEVEALVELGRESRVPMGVILADSELCRGRVSATWKNKTVRQIAGNLIAHRSYRVNTEGEVLLIEPSKIPEHQRRLLDLKIPRFAVPPGTLREQESQLWASVKQTLNPRQGSIANILSSPAARTYPGLEFKNLTVRQILNQLSIQVDGIWVLLPLAGASDSFPQRSPFLLGSYQDIESLKEVKCYPRR